MPTLDFETLKAAVASSSPAIRSVTRLQPAGGPGDKIFPPTYTKEGKAINKYAFEHRRIDGREVSVVLLDSVASQANRMEEALLAAWKAGALPIPVVQVDFSKIEKLSDLGQITALQAPHRLADAILRDSLLEGKPFRHSDMGREFSDARPDHATPIYRYCPTALIFGMWDSTGPKGGLGAKFQRVVVSEIVGIDAVPGTKTASRIDPVHIQRIKKGSVYQHLDRDQDWTLEESEAVKDAKGKPQPFARGAGKGESGTPAAVNHGNIPPSIDLEAGGVTMDHALQTAVISLVAIRRLRFKTTTSNVAIASERRLAAEHAAHTSLAALAVAALACTRSYGYDLRSRSLLIPSGPFTLEILSADGDEPRRFELDAESACKLVKQAEKEARKFGLGWDSDPITLTPAPKLCALIERSREAAAETDET